MYIVFLTAAGVGGATVIGSLLGFLFRRSSQRLADAVFCLASAIMLISAIFGLLVPAYSIGGAAVFFIGGGIGALCLFLVDLILPRIRSSAAASDKKFKRALLLLLAIGIHNFPEGIAAGVGFGAYDTSRALFIAGEIALQNLPEGMVVVSPMLNAGISPKKTFMLALLTGSFEVIGTCFGYFASRMSSALMPYILAFAGGNMVYIVIEEVSQHIRHRAS